MRPGALEEVEQQGACQLNRATYRCRMRISSHKIARMELFGVDPQIPRLEGRRLTRKPVINKHISIELENSIIKTYE